MLQNIVFAIGALSWVVAFFAARGVYRWFKSLGK